MNGDEMTDGNMEHETKGKATKDNVEQNQTNQNTIELLRRKAGILNHSSRVGTSIPYKRKLYDDPSARYEDPVEMCRHEPYFLFLNSSVQSISVT